MKKLNVLFLCTGNSCRSQMAEGFGRALLGDKHNFYSAGTAKHGKNPRAIKVMEEIGIYISSQESNTTDEIEAVIDVVFTVCSHAHENCPYFEAAAIKHVGFDDPPSLTKGMQDEESILDVYRRVRDEIKDFVSSIESEL